ncbi:hypothetical protein FLP10_11885 [Agromyces intestinalis]|uniref:Polysaccharide chain length determinant N-terminal domain-containing protein n=1 Tax=Agromyces intestinalis TaxID=2592652 RepID=A0A5C1YHF2_9MICO|nr:hypothetical protein [Agromyces intestinalis]QEO15038.1 hypothetical protein FLP10_11885 [Agromyces intestinalis]
MNLTESLRMLMRRWYLFFPAVILTMVLAFVVFFLVRPTYERNASLLLLPDSASIPEGGNPYLFMSGLSGVGDVVVRAANSQTFHDSITDEHPGTEVVIGRDQSTASPVIAISVESDDDDIAGVVLTTSIEHVTSTLNALQADEGISSDRRIVAVPLVADDTGVVVQRTRFMITAGVAAVGLLISILTPAIVEGMSRRRRRVGAAVAEQPADDADVSVDVARPSDPPVSAVRDDPWASERERGPVSDDAFRR